jgi:alkylated DNA repair dioxygenase AlkB
VGTEPIDPIDSTACVIEQTLPLLSPAQVDLGLTGGLEVAVDETFAMSYRIHLDQTSWIDHVPGWLSGGAALMEMLIQTAAWEQRTRWMYTRVVDEPRLTAEYPVISDAPQPVLRYLADVLSARYERRYHRLWMNHYRDHNDGTGWHADRPADKQRESVIPVLSLGASRRFLIRPVAGGASTIVAARDGDLVVMGGRCQRDYQHSVPKVARFTGPRVSLNFSSVPR